MRKQVCKCIQSVEETLINTKQFTLNPNTSGSVEKEIPLSPQFLQLAELQLKDVRMTDKVSIHATVGSRVEELSGDADIIYKVYRNVISEANIVFSGRVELDDNQNDFSIDSFFHVDVKPSIGNVKYILTVELIEQSQEQVFVVGPITFVIEQIRAELNSKCMCTQPVKQTVVDLNHIVLSPNESGSFKDGMIPVGPMFLRLAELSLDQITPNDIVLLMTTVGTEALMQSPILLYKIFRNSVNDANLIFSSRTEIDETLQDEFSIDSFIHVDLKPTLGKVKYILTVEVETSFNDEASVIGPLSFVIQQIRTKQGGKCSCNLASNIQLVDVNQFVLPTNVSESILMDIGMGPLELARSSFEKIRPSDLIVINATVGAKVSEGGGNPDLLYKVYRNSIVASNLIFSAKSELDEDGNDFAIDSFTHVDTKPTLGKVSYILTVENIEANTQAQVIGPITFKLDQYRKI
ncbi:hypothetical protein [Cytobacillus sp. IB215665]|uniref:hypothetical protein n=1 Tax=Cytobacillus sp. IB215665 TaxID=3097357 RepID=UPI002A0B8BDE|nr:hypothetical protein [Cytobacillus sp. IB215665]MDX8366196.1 hypothetical protein [Cytobacillus sp. IB215665]